MDGKGGQRALGSLRRLRIRQIICSIRNIARAMARYTHTHTHTHTCVRDEGWESSKGSTLYGVYSSSSRMLSDCQIQPSATAAFPREPNYSRALPLFRDVKGKIALMLCTNALQKQVVISENEAT